MPTITKRSYYMYLEYYYVIFETFEYSNLCEFILEHFLNIRLFDIRRVRIETFKIRYM